MTEAKSCCGLGQCGACKVISASGSAPIKPEDSWRISGLRYAGRVRPRALHVEVDNPTDEPQQADLEAGLTGDDTHATRPEASVVLRWYRVDMAIAVEDP
jgi:hypothetical protein